MGYHRQPSQRGRRRTPVNAAIIDAIERRLEQAMRRFKVSRSFVIATVLAYHFDIEEQADYHMVAQPRVVGFRQRRRA